MRSGSAIPVRVYWVLAAGLIAVSFSPILVRVADEAPAPTVALLRTMLAVVFLLPFAARTARRDWLKYSTRTRGLTIAAGVLLGVHFIVWIESIYHTSVASASVLFTTNPLFIAGFGFLILGERLSRVTIVAIVVSVFGATLIGAGDAADADFPRALFGNALAISAAITFSAYLLIGRLTRQSSDWIAYVFPLYTVVAVVVATYAFIRGFPVVGFGWEVYVACALMALGPQILGHGSLNYAVRYFPAAVLGLLGLVEPVIATMFAWILFDELPGQLAVVGMVITLGALLLLYSTRSNLSTGSEENVLRPRRK
jgi:drug/metabolite transporter (DMT)-like permease